MKKEEIIVLTTCTAAYLAQAKALGDSLLQHNPGYKFVIGLVDKLAGRIEKDYYSPHELIEVEELNLPQFEEMHGRYSTLELVCSVKSFFTDHLFKKYAPSRIIFLDCDILIFDSLSPVLAELDAASILLTAHISQPFPPDKHKPREKEILKTGMFNAGFYAVRNDDEAKRFIDWWKVRMVDQCYERPKEGLNADQKWLNFLPFYFDKVKTVTHPGCNVAYWNLHERVITRQQDKFFVNGLPLLFFHFSGFSPEDPDQVSRHQDRFVLREYPALGELFDTYREILLRNDHKKLQHLSCYYKPYSEGILKKLGLKKKE